MLGIQKYRVTTLGCILGLPSRLVIEDLSDVYTHSPTNKAGSGEPGDFNTLGFLWFECRGLTRPFTLSTQRRISRTNGYYFVTY